MEQFIFDILKMYIEFILYNYSLVENIYIVTILLFALLILAFHIANFESDIGIKNFKFSVAILVVLLFLALIYPSQETLQTIMK